MTGQKVIYTPDGYALEDIRAGVIRSSLLNDVGEAVFYIAVSDIKCREEILQYGNYFLCTHPKLPDWVGIIDTPRIWKNGYVEVHAYEVPHILRYRLTPLNQKIAGSPGTKLSYLINTANNRGDTLLRIGFVDQNGTDYEEVLTDSVYTIIKNIAATNGFEWTCSPQIDSLGKLTIKIDWMAKGSNATDLELSQGHNIMYGDVPLEESGELFSSIEGISMIEGSENASQITQTYSEDTPFGLREQRISFDGITDPTSLLHVTTQYMKDHSHPSYGTPLVVLDVGSTFNNVRLRNAVKYKYTNVGFSNGQLGYSGDVKIEGYLYDEIIGTCELFTSRI